MKLPALRTRWSTMHFDLDIATNTESHFCLSLYWDHDERNISNSHWQFGPKEGALTISDRRVLRTSGRVSRFSIGRISDTAFIELNKQSWLQGVGDEYLVTDVYRNRKVYSSIEYHCYELQDDM